MRYSDVQGGRSGVGNINADPGFVGQTLTGPLDYGLTSGSPCIDAGDNAAVPVGVETDVAGLPRFVDDPGTPDSGFGQPPVVDMGALEFQVATSCPADLDGDSVVRIQDFLVLLANFGSSGPGDIDGNGTVDVQDFLLLLAAWGPCD
ncbi:MAG: choice-of-anchor Q domain-containing protein [Planctomycetota bacterium]